VEWDIPLILKDYINVVRFVGLMTDL
jgi:hypothetical protein